MIEFLYAFLYIIVGLAGSIVYCRWRRKVGKDGYWDRTFTESEIIVVNMFLWPIMILLTIIQGIVWCCIWVIEQ